MIKNNGNGVKEYKRYQSRKWQLVIIVMVIATLGLFVPPLVSLWAFKASKALFLITGTEWVSVVTLIVAAYFGANVWQKHVEKRTAGGGVLEVEETVQLNEEGEA
jgi:hypothetical protein